MIVFPLSEDEAVELNQLIARYLQEDLTDAMEPDGHYDFGPHANVFPSWPFLQHRDRTDRILPELSLMASDAFEHHLTPLYQFTLFRSMESWIAVERDSAEMADDEKHAAGCEERADRLEDFLDDAFPDTDFLNASVLAKLALKRPDLQGELDVDVARFLETMPNDVADEVRRALAKAERQSGGGSADKP